MNKNDKQIMREAKSLLLYLQNKRQTGGMKIPLLPEGCSRPKAIIAVFLFMVVSSASYYLIQWFLLNYVNPHINVIVDFQFKNKVNSILQKSAFEWFTGQTGPTYEEQVRAQHALRDKIHDILQLAAGGVNFVAITNLICNDEKLTNIELNELKKETNIDFNELKKTGTSISSNNVLKVKKPKKMKTRKKKQVK